MNNLFISLKNALCFFVKLLLSHMSSSHFILILFMNLCYAHTHAEPMTKVNVVKPIDNYGLSYSKKNNALTTRLYVKANASGANNGSDWANAFTSLQSALANATGIDEIWVAKGTYKPTADINDANPVDPREKTFVMRVGTKIYGSFAGTETNLSARSPSVISANPSILSGDIDEETDPLIISGTGSTLTFSGNSGNSYHVIYNNSNGLTPSNALLDGFTITGGNGGGSQGGGIYNNASSPSLSHLIVIGNYGQTGGGMTNSNNSKPILSYSTFKQNRGVYGGAMTNETSSEVTINQVVFIGNNAYLYGAGIYTNFSAKTLITNSVFTANYALFNGGAMANNNFGMPTIINVTFFNNRAMHGGALYNLISTVNITNCIFWGNKDDNNVINSIENNINVNLIVNYSDIQMVSGVHSGTSNLNQDPLFV